VRAQRLMDKLEGTVLSITFRNEENYYTVARFEPLGQRGSVTVVGHFPAISVGETLLLEGEWREHPKYGRQFAVSRFEGRLPVDERGIERYLASGVISGVGPATARKLVSHFGASVLEVLEEAPERLLEVEGIGEVKAARIAESYREHRDIRDVMIFLQSYGVTPAYAARIYRTYGERTVEAVRENPYRLADDVHGIGFKTADKIAREMGVPHDSPYRMAAGLKFVLTEMVGKGHTYMPREELLQATADLLEVEIADLSGPLEGLLEGRELVMEEVDGVPAVYTSSLYHAESGAARSLRRLAAGSGQLGFPASGLRLDGGGLTLTPEQEQAVQAALAGGVTVITGGPGTGKTTIVRSLVDLLETRGLRVILCAPTGRAAKRLGESCGRPATTIHRLLGYGRKGAGLRYDEDKPLPADVVIVDEVSMLDVILAHQLLRAISTGSSVVLVGDADQLPSVGPGNVLRDIIRSGAVKTVELSTVFRQAQESSIVTNAHRINRGLFPRLGSSRQDFFFMEEEDPERVHQLILDLVARRLPSFRSYDPVEDIQVLSPMHRTQTGVQALNSALQKALNPRGPALRYGGAVFRLGDKVMQLRNDYDRDVYNGDIGRVVAVDPEEGELTVRFPDPGGSKLVRYYRRDLEDLVLAYATSVHKSQGSEYPVVVMPVCTQHYMMLQRNLLYTAVTRARELVVLVGTKKAMYIALKNQEVEQRYSGLAWRLSR